MNAIKYIRKRNTTANLTDVGISLNFLNIATPRNVLQQLLKKPKLQTLCEQ